MHMALSPSVELLRFAAIVVCLSLWLYQNHEYTLLTTILISFRSSILSFNSNTTDSRLASKSATGRERRGIGAAKSSSSSTSSAPLKEGDMTVEQFLGQQCDAIIGDVQKHAATLIAKLREEYATGTKEIRDTMTSSSSKDKRICVVLKCTTGPHLGQKFRLELAGDKEEDTFKIGRSTGKPFKEKGVSLYKDKEVSTAHAKVEIRNGQAFYIDMKSTNGSALNGKDVEKQVPIRLKDGDILSIGGTEVHVSTSAMADEEEENENNFASV